MSKLVVHYTFIEKEMRKLLKSRMNISHGLKVWVEKHKALKVEIFIILRSETFFVRAPYFYNRPTPFIQFWRTHKIQKINKIKLGLKH